VSFQDLRPYRWAGVIGLTWKGLGAKKNDSVMGKEWLAKHKQNSSGHDFSSCRGFGIILGTCDAAKERETSKEMVNLFSEAIEQVYPGSLLQNSQKNNDELEPTEKKESLSIADLMKQEISDIKTKKTANLSTVVSIKTDVKGIALVKLLKPEYCPVTLLRKVFDNIKSSKKGCCRYVVRLIPLKHVIFPKEDDFLDNMPKIFNTEFGINIDEPKLVASSTTGEKRPREEDEEDSTQEAPVAKIPKVDEESVSDQTESAVVKRPLNTQEKFRYAVHFKARNHNVLTKQFVNDSVIEALKDYGIADFRYAKVIFCCCMYLMKYCCFFPASLARHNN
jgi:hypothetical protein